MLGCQPAGAIANYETLLSSAFKPSLLQEEHASPRVSDLPSLIASTTGKIELESVEEGRPQGLRTAF